MAFMGMFRKNPLEKIEQRDEKEEVRLEKLLRSIRSSIGEFKRILKLDNIEEKDGAIEELHDQLTNAIQNLLVVIDDEHKLQQVESTDARYAISQDDRLLSDKEAQLGRIKELIEALIEILDENPNLSEYKGEYLDTVNTDLSEVEVSFSRIVQDDEQLDRIYKTLS